MNAAINSDEAFIVQIKIVGHWATVFVAKNEVGAAREASNQFEFFHDCVRVLSPTREILAIME